MGTNYYLVRPECPTCGHGNNRLHIGKSSAGWNFGLRIYPDTDDGEPHEQLEGWSPIEIVELDDDDAHEIGWGKLFELHAIEDEYGNPVSTAAMIEIITKRTHPNGLLSRVTLHQTTLGHTMTAMPGKGTYDLCAYEFS